MFERFTDRARRAVVLAQEEARLLNHNYIGTEHLLLGVVHERTSVAAHVLSSQGISLEALRQQLEEIIGRGQQPPSGHVPLTPRAKRVLELSAREADALGDGQVSTDHIVLGLLREGEGVAVQVMVRLGVDLNGVREQVLQRLRGQGDGHAPGGSSGLGDDALARIDSLAGRVAAIERWVGMRPDLADLDEQLAQLRGEKEAAINQQDFETAAALRDKEKRLISRRASRENEPAGGTDGRPSLAGELDRLSGELARLRAILRQRGIDPGDDAP
jgi:ATP-dependent Clp protease ATP-binding subunit ClpA